MDRSHSLPGPERKQIGENGPSAYFGRGIRFQPLGPAAPDRFDYRNNHRPDLISTLFTAGCQSCVLARATTSLLFDGHRKEAGGLFASRLMVFILPEERGGSRVNHRTQDVNVHVPET